MLWNAEEIIRAIEETSVGGPNLGVVQVGRTSNYVRIFGPSVTPENHAPCLIVERYNGTVSVNRGEVARSLRFEDRPHDKSIAQDPLGASSGANGKFGGADWGLSSGKAARRFESLSKYAEALVKAMKAANSW